jgi:transposase InsO family protein
MVIELVLAIRKRLPRCGGKKLYYMLSEDFARLDYQLGRDKFFELLRDAELLVPRKRARHKTTNSAHSYRIYANLTVDLAICRPFQVIVADITYIRVGEGFCYLSLLTDVHTRFIVGYELLETLEAAGPLSALRSAMKFMGEVKGCIHHSDRGVQYCCHEYMRRLCGAHMQASMCAVGAPEENALAERVNGILKDEFLLDQTFPSARTARRACDDAVDTYNTFRPHYSLGLATPLEFLRDCQRHSSRRRKSRAANHK